jgi:predicted transcriptional regulator
MTATRVITAHVPTELAEKVDRLAELYDRPRGWVIKQALKAWVLTEEEKDRLTLEALADIDAGNSVPHEDIMAWAHSLGGPNPLLPPHTEKK